jgi:hypothetical protein
VGYIRIRGDPLGINAVHISLVAGLVDIGTSPLKFQVHPLLSLLVTSPKRGRNHYLGLFQHKIPIIVTSPFSVKDPHEFSRNPIFPLSSREWAGERG